MNNPFILHMLAIAALLIIAVRWLIALFNLITAQPRTIKTEVLPGELSVLIPARNEARTLPDLLESLQHCGESIGEIIIYNDQSDDDTSVIASQWAGGDPRIRVLEGRELPEGWLGKNHACYQLARASKGKYLLFLDADVKTNKNAVELALSHVKKEKLALFSFFPSQEMHTRGEWLLVAQINVILNSLLPLALTTYIPFYFLAAANGQFMMFDGAIYRHHQFHKKLRTTAVEDVAIARTIKKTGLRVRAALAPKGLTCRMYHNYRDALEGLARSARFFFGGSIIAGWIYVIFSLLGWLPVLITMHSVWFVAYFLMIITMRIFVASASHQSVIKNIVLMPFQQIALFHMFFKATNQMITGKSTWKGRKI